MNCTYETCGRKTVKGGTLCRSHYRRRSSGNIDEPIGVKQYEVDCLVNGCDVRAEVKELCRRHYGLFIKHGKVPLYRNVSSSKWKTRAGYVVLGARNTENPNQGERTYEHAAIMQIELGRRLVKGESVHHINGDRADNRPENLELWSTSQPSGQRVKDKIAWAKEILSLYGETDVL